MVCWCVVLLLRGLCVCDRSECVYTPAMEAKKDVKWERKSKTQNVIKKDEKEREKRKKNSQPFQK
jgi:hypothetical protein